MKRFKSRLILGLAFACAAITFSLAVSAQAQILHAVGVFDGPNGNGPYSSVVQGPDGNIYGTTDSGGNDTQSGTLFRLTPSGEVTDLYNFCSLAKCADGWGPDSAPVVGIDGNFYGVVQGGGSGQLGTFYRMTLDGEFTTLYNFCATRPCTGGGAPTGIILGGDGNFYGTTDGGGNASGSGTIFSISPTGQLTLLHTFCSLTPNCLDGARAFYPPILGSDGNLYGVTWGGGSLGGGVLYELTPSGTYSVLYNFCGQELGCSGIGEPYYVVRDANGNFFGTTEYNAEGRGYGSVFEFTSTNQLLVLHNFDDDNDWPYTGLTIANDGNVYGVFGYDTKASGSIFTVTPAGVYTRIYSFDPDFRGDAGAPPVGPLFQGTDGSFYGVTPYGPGDFDGEVFRFSNGLSPLVETVPVMGPVGQSVLILGNGLTGSTSVTFGGVAAAFTVESDTYISATVPSGATTGAVSVVTPSGTLKGSPQFVVTK
jgi:uncharacterized repeat protein (TIGR03803 family)